MTFRLGQDCVSATLQIPDGLTAEDLEAVEDMILNWKDEAHYRAIDLVVAIDKYLTSARTNPRSAARTLP
jgi:hypothetical protein